MTPRPWPEVLDALEARLRRQEDVVAGRSASPVGGALPVPDGPMPPELLPRALAVLERTRHLEQRNAAALNELRRDAPARAYSAATAARGAAFDL